MRKPKDPDMLPEYDFRGGVRGKYFGKVDMDAPVVVLGKSGPRKRAQAVRSRNGKKRKRA